MNKSALTTLAAMAFWNDDVEKVEIECFWGNLYLVAIDADRRTLVGRCRLDGSEPTSAADIVLSDGHDGRFVPTMRDLNLTPTTETIR